ncbi:MAG: 50S ribosomal protein L4 [Kistimonas sp.]|nr:50S ribosomal protein L4 [Kistimonas sp.]
MNLNVVDADNLEVSDVAFGAELNKPLVHQAVVAFLAGGRQGTKSQKTRSDVRGGGRKPFRQKGTGRARAGSIRSPLWRGGGVTFAASPRNHAQKLNKKMYRGALRSILSELVRQERLVVVSRFEISAPRTRDMAARLAELEATNALVVSDTVDRNLYLSARNIPLVDVRDVQAVDPVSLMAHDKVVMTVGALKQFEEMLG